MRKIINSGAYPWKYCSLGGVTRVRIETGVDVAHLAELDQKMWTVLSCPVDGLEFDPETLKVLDADGDRKIKAFEVIEASKWLTGALKSPNLVVNGTDEIALDALDDKNPVGAHIKENAEKILKNLKKDTGVITLADTEKPAVADVYPYGANTAAALVAVAEVKEKVADFFLRCKLVTYDEACAEILASSTAELIGKDVKKSLKNLEDCPLSKPNKEGVITFSSVNPVWQDKMNAVRSLVFGGAATINEADWNAAVAKFAVYESALAEAGSEEKLAAMVEKQKEDAALVDDVRKFLLLLRDFYAFLRNYIIFTDLYDPTPGVRAMFEAGDLYIDQRCCSLCIKVSDMGKQADMAGLSGMFLIYCSCTKISTGEKMDIAAVMTNGGIENLRPGKNAIFYDRNGETWDAVVTKIIDNPISIRQAFWSPYRKLANFISDKITKSAAEKESNAIASLQTAADAAPAAVEKKDAPKVPFDIAKFAGIFAAIGMALGYIGAFCTTLVTGVTSAPFWKTLLVIAGLLLVISGPSCFLAWIKLRRRNLGPVLNANGWAINSVVLINVLFGGTLTKVAKYPLVKSFDPYKEVVPVWKKILRGVIAAVIVAAVAFFVYKKFCPAAEPVCEPVEQVAAETAEQPVAETEIAAE